MPFLVDDMGYGDPGSFDAESKIPTPNIDALARDGMRLTDHIGDNASESWSPIQEECWRSRGIGQER